MVLTTFYEYFYFLWNVGLTDFRYVTRVLLKETNCWKYSYYVTKTHYKQETSIYPRFEQYWTIICFFFLIISNLEIDYIPDVSFMLYNSMLISYRSSQNAFRNNYQMIKFLRWVTKLHNTKIHQTERKTNILSFFYNRQYGAKVRTCISQLPVI